MRKEILLSGYGGQGLVLAGIILAEAAVLYEGMNATHNQSYGPEARGGASRSEVIISDEEINYPEIDNPDILLAMTQDAMDKYGGKVKEDGVIIVDTLYVKDLSPGRGVKKIYEFPITQISIEETGKSLSANIVALGLIVEATGVVKRESLEKAVLKRVPPNTRETNLRALKAAFKAFSEKVGQG
ncbi:MAG: 2-oxoacid:acceptor oxidoreductase family protein [Synergistetes bacterium]|nr:2-oxoacid:acceptor oxidoreductase family protein [Synergistota bacterium]